jgi:hypothetical protein
VDTVYSCLESSLRRAFFVYAVQSGGYMALMTILQLLFGMIWSACGFRI